MKTQKFILMLVAAFACISCTMVHKAEVNNAYPHAEVFEVQLDWQKYYQEVPDRNVYRAVVINFYTSYRTEYVNNKRRTVPYDACTVVYEDAVGEYPVTYEAKDIKGLKLGDVVRLSDKEDGNKILKHYKLYLKDAQVIPYDKPIAYDKLLPDTVGVSNKNLYSPDIGWNNIDFPRLRKTGVKGPMRWITNIKFIKHGPQENPLEPYFIVTFYDERGVLRYRNYPRITISAERIKRRDIVEVRYTPDGIPVFVKLPDYKK